jgi:hypothetical protein
MVNRLTEDLVTLLEAMVADAKSAHDESGPMDPGLTKATLYGERQAHLRDARRLARLLLDAATIDDPADWRLIKIGKTLGL